MTRKKKAQTVTHWSAYERLINALAHTEPDQRVEVEQELAEELLHDCGRLNKERHAALENLRLVEDREAKTVEALTKACIERDEARAALEWRKSPAESCKEERAAGNGGCGACALCCKELRDELETLKLGMEQFRKGWEGVAKTAETNRRESWERMLTAMLERDATRAILRQYVLTDNSSESDKNQAGMLRKQEALSILGTKPK